ncbi:MAG: glutamyl-tRNA amidotransferase [Candidatus Moranbacteria bacterium CG_4_8_14_3_um_filter_34_16]|nr:MAG: glutamyl-tRNA amidotransferase [Candidatus Moranbacteria bacterium CG08_land_8_20_14_0_20_34_16]PIW95126.1 MAG: glutamyl-tRNA amidotransferase [Candidatus Moranbacteria bacterium CG_4_8_14_3_um_filter_34_16]
MLLKQKIAEDLKSAMKSGDTLRRDALRMLSAFLKNVEIEKKKRDEGLNDEEVQAVVLRAIKQRRDSATQYLSGGRTDLAEKETQEAEIFSVYLPQQLTRKELEKEVEKNIVGFPEIKISDMGKIMRAVMGKLKGQADGNLVREIVEKKIKSVDEN